MRESFRESFLDDVRATLLPGRDSPHEPLAPLLVAMTVVTGLVDAFSYLVLGHVFVANMAGNILFLGFALVGEHSLSVAAPLVALGTFLVGAAMGPGPRHCGVGRRFDLYRGSVKPCVDMITPDEIADRPR